MRVLIVDDEMMARKRLVRLLGAIEGVEIAGEAEDGEAALAMLREEPVDVVLLDIHMPGLSGTDVMGLLGADGPQIVFTTAYAEHAVRAFDGGATDYLLKPIEPPRLAKALDRAREKLDGPAVAAGTPGKLAIPTRKGIELVDPADISYAAIEGESVVLETRKGRFYTEFRLNDLEKRLPASFVRVHRQAIVNVERVERLEDVDTGGYLAVLDDGARVAVSRQVARQLRRQWGMG